VSASGGLPFGAVMTAQLPLLPSHEGPYSLTDEEEGRTLGPWGLPFRAEEEGLRAVVAGGGIWTARWCRLGGGVSGTRTPPQEYVVSRAFLTLLDGAELGVPRMAPGSPPGMRRGRAGPEMEDLSRR